MQAQLPVAAPSRPVLLALASAPASLVCSKFSFGTVQGAQNCAPPASGPPPMYAACNRVPCTHSHDTKHHVGASRTGVAGGCTGFHAPHCQPRPCASSSPKQSHGDRHNPPRSRACARACARERSRLAIFTSLSTACWRCSRICKFIRTSMSFNASRRRFTAAALAERDAPVPEAVVDVHEPQ